MKPVIFLISALIALIVIQSCKKDSAKNNNEAIVGNWENRQIYPNASGRSQLYTFNGDGTYETRFTVFNPVSNQLLGYYYKSIGKYALNGDQLSFKNVTNYGIKNDNGTTPAVPEDQLVITSQGNGSVYNVGYSAKKDSLSLLVNCPINADCIGLLWYKRHSN